MDAKHTPGPWAAKRLGPPSLCLEIMAGAGGPPYPLAKVYESAPPFTTKGSKARAEADAQLIAAAPELLAALARLIDCPALNLDGAEPEDAMACTQAHEAIAKATGKD